MEQNEPMEQNEKEPVVSKEPVVFVSSTPVIGPPPKTEAPPARQYKLPDDIGAYITVEDCDNGLLQMKADVMADKNHPYVNRDHSLHKAYVEFMTGLYETRNSLIPAATTDDYLKAQKQKLADEQAKVYEEAVEINKELLSLGYKSWEIPGNISKDVTHLLKLMLWNAQPGPENKARLDGELQRVVRPFANNKMVKNLYASYQAVRDESKDALAYELIHVVADLQRRKEDARKHPQRFGG